MRRAVFYLIILLIAVGLVFGIYARSKRSATPVTEVAKAAPAVATTKAPPPDVSAAKIKNVKGEIDIRNAFITVADKVGKAIVTISTERTQKVGFKRPPQFRFKGFGQGSPFGDGEDPFEKFFEDFFGPHGEREFKQRGLGSGFIIDKKGHILTNFHVVDGADVINITLPDGRSFEGVVKGVDPRSDLAVVKINAKNLPVAELGNSDLVQVGEWVVALGNPYGHVLQSPKPTVTVGVVSALHRRIPTPSPSGDRGYLDMIQTDAAINPGNSGGPLCDLNGSVIGINVVIFSTSGGYQGVGFAIPVNEAKKIINDLIEGKEIAYGWLGVSVQEITPELAEYFNLPDRKGGLVAAIFPESPAQKAGLKEGDIITSINGKEINTLHDILKEVNKTKIDTTARVDIIRDKVKKIINVKIEKKPQTAEAAEEKMFEIPEETEKWRGIKVLNITDKIASELELEDKVGVVIIEVDRSSAGHKAGLRKGDVIREINKTKIKNLIDYKKIASEANGIALVRTDKGYATVKKE
ncbi:MAG: Do family serine endopeptidase [Candidatus Omnitrophica bacterium]|nr:Do family serine endopeptidase [Candidatus Omnitrophota bacterium]